jgi:hypothetical protein
LKILEELAVDGTSKTYEEIWLSDYKEIPVGINTFLDSDTYLGKTNDNGKSVYPFWRKELNAVFDAGNKYYEWILTGATRIGKSSTAVTAVAYMLYRLMCLRSPQKFFGKKEISKFSILFFNLTLDLAKGVAFHELQSTLKASPWFCLRGDTEVLTPHGYVKIKNLVNSDTEVYSYSDGDLKLIKPDSISVTGFADELIEIELDDGTVISGTPDHRVMLSDGSYKCLKDVDTEDDLMEICTEYFVPMAGFEDIYEISNMGRIRNVTDTSNQFTVASSRIRKFKYHKHGYDTIDVRIGGAQVTQTVPELMMRTFYPDLPSYSFYLKGDIHDNSLSNLCPGRRNLDGVWKDVPGTHGIVQACDDGTLYCHTYVRYANNRRSIVREHKIHTSVDGYGYCGLSDSILTDIGIRLVHRAVALAFIPNPDNKPEVNHIDANKKNNCASNLEWATSEENKAHAMSFGLCSGFKRRKVIEVGSNLKFERVGCAAEYFNISVKTVRRSLDQGVTLSNGLRFEVYES